MPTCKWCGRACNRPLCRWPNLAQAREHPGSNDETSRRSRPPCLGLSSVHVVVFLEILTIPSIKNNRWSHSQGHRLPTHLLFFKPEFSHWHRSCFLFHVSKSDLSGYPGGQKWLTPGAELSAPNPRPVEDRSLLIFVGKIRGRPGCEKSLFFESHSPRKHIELC